MSQLSLMLLGTPVVQQAERVVTFRTRKAQALLIYLAVEGGLHSREELAAMFWPESGPSQGRTTLRSTLAYLRSALKESRPPPQLAEEERQDVYLSIERDLIGFNPEAGFKADWLSLQAAWSLARNPTPAAPAIDSHHSNLNSLLTQFQTAAELYRGDFLTGFTLDDAPGFDDWASIQRETYHRQMGLVFDRLSQGQAEGGQLISAIETTTRWVVFDPLNEAAHRRLMQLHFAAEDRAAALLAYEACRAVLRRELNADPSPETESLADRIRDFGFTIYDLRLADTDPNRKSKIINRKSEELPLVGRANEHLALVTAYRAMRRGQPQGVILAGEPGIGKSRLAKEFLGWAAAHGADVLQGRAFETSRRLPYQAVIEALRERLERENAPDDLLPDLWLVELSRLLPELRERYPDLPAPGAEETTAQPRLFEAVARLGQALAQRTPLILFLDDLHWADAASLDLLQYAARRWTAAGSPVLLLFTLRTEELFPTGDSPPGPGLSDWLLTLHREISLTRLTLEPLALADVELLVQTLDAEGRVVGEDFPSAPSIPRSPAGLSSTYLAEFSQRLFSETGGQPFFLIETLKMLFERYRRPTVEKEAGHLWEDPAVDFDTVVSRYLQGSDRVETPFSIQEMISARLARLGPAAQTACLAAAVLGEPFDFERLQDVAGLEEDEGLAALEELLKRGLVRELRQVSARPYLLAHDRFREVVYNQASPPRRRIFHRRALETLEAVKAPPAELARHAWAAGLLERAAALDILAGDEAMALYAPQTAIGHYSRALEAAAKLEQTPSSQLYRARGRAYETIGDFDRACGDFQLALAETRATTDRPGEWQTLLDLGFLWTSHDYTQASDYFQQALSLARVLNQPATLAHSLNRVGNWHANIEQPARALGFHQEALAIFESLAERPGQAETLDLLAMACYMAGKMQQSLDYYAQAVALFRELDNRRGLVSSLSMMSMVMRATFTVEVPPETDVAQSVPLAESAVQMAREIGWRAGESHALVALGQNLYHQGKYGAALAAVQSGLIIAVEIEHPLWITYAHWALGLIYLELLALPEAQQQLEQALKLAGKTGSMFWQRISTALLCLVYRLQNEPNRAEAALRVVLEPDDGRIEAVEWLAQTSMQRLVWYARAELALTCHEPLLALQIADHLTAATSTAASERPVLRLLMLQGEALAALGRTKEAEAALRKAQAVAIRQAEPPLLWRIHLALSWLYQALKRQAEAERELTAAQAIIAELAVTIEDAALRENFRQSALT